MGSYTAHTRVNMGSRGGMYIPDHWASFFRDALKPFFYLRQFGTIKTIPNFEGDRIRIPLNYTPFLITNGVAGRNPTLSAVCAGMSDNTTIAPKNVISGNELTCSPTWFEGASAYNRNTLIVTPLDFEQTIMEHLGGDMAVVLDRFYYAAVSGTNLKINGFPSGSTTKVAGTNLLRAKNLAQAAARMQTYCVPTFDDGNYVIYSHPLVRPDIVNDVSANGFIAVTQYGDPTRIYNGEIGKLHGFRVVLTNTMPRYSGGATSATHYMSGGVTGTHAICFSPGAFYIAEFAGNQGLEFTHRPPTCDLADPNAKIGIIGVRTASGVVKAPATEGRILTIACATSMKP